MSFNKLIFIIILLSFFGCTKDHMPSNIELDTELTKLIRQSSPDNTIDFYVLPVDDLTSIPQDPKNKLTEDKVALGKLLYHETALAQNPLKPSGRGTYSCASCHVAEAGFRPGSFQGIGDGGDGFGMTGENRGMNTEYLESEIDVQNARALSMVNVAYVENSSWSGQFGSTGANEGTEYLWDENEETERNHLGFHALETQNFEGARLHRLAVSEDLLSSLGYKEMYDNVFPEVPTEERYTIDNTALLLSAYIRSIVSDRAPFQYWLKGNTNAMSYEEKSGAILFFGKAQCSQCHYNQNLGSDEFHALGAKDIYQSSCYNGDPNAKRNLGRGGFTHNEEDMFRFRVPGIYNSIDAQFYLHGSSMRTMEQLIEFKNQAISENPNVDNALLSKKFKPLNLTKEEMDNLYDFMAESLRDPNLTRYKPESVLSGNCIPDNDPTSKIEIGCE